jgi:hypothetical protein
MDKHRGAARRGEITETICGYTFTSLWAILADVLISSECIDRFGCTLKVVASSVVYTF